MKIYLHLYTFSAYFRHSFIASCRAVRLQYSQYI